MEAAVAPRRQLDHPGWRHAGESLVRELFFRDFDEAIAGITEAEIRWMDKVDRVIVLWE